MQPRRLIPWIAFVLEAVFLVGTLAYLFSPQSIGDPWYMTVNIPRMLGGKIADHNFVAIVCLTAIAATLILLGRIQPVLSGRAGWILAALALMAIAPVLRPIFWCGLVFMLASASGRFVLRATGLLKQMGPVESPVVFFAVGMIALVIEIFALSQFSLLGPRPIAAVMLVKAVLLRGDLAAIWNHMDSRVKSYRAELNSPGTRILVLLLIVFWGISLACAALPPNLYDEISYHMAFPKVYAQMHRVPFLPGLDLSADGSFSMFHFAGILATNIETIFSYMYALAGPVCVHMFQVMCLILTCLAAIEIAAVRGSFRGGLMAALLFASFPLQNLMASTSHIEIALAVCVTASIGLLLRHLTEQRAAYPITAGLIAGFAVSSKLSMLLLVGLFLAGLLVQAIVARRETRRIAAHALVFVTMAGLSWAPWLWRSYHLTGDPLFPVGTSFVVNKAMSVAGLEPRTPQPAAPQHPEFASNLVRPVAYPWLITFSGTKSGYYQSPEGSMGYAFFILLPLGLLFPLRRRKEWGFLALICALTAACIPSLDRVRYALPYFPLLCLAIGLGTAAGLDALGARGRGACMAGLSLLFALNLLYIPCGWDFRSIPLDYVVKPPSDQAYYGASPNWKTKYEVAREVNRFIKSPADRVVEIGWDLVCPYFCDGIWYNLNAVNREFVERVRATRTGDAGAISDFADYLSQRSVKLVVVSDENLNRPGSMDALVNTNIRRLNYQLPGLDFMRGSERFKLAGNVNRYTIFRVAAKQPRIEAYGPKSIKRPGGSIDMWFQVQPAAGSLGVVFDGKPLDSVRKGNVVTATIPAEMLARPGRIPIHLGDPETGDQTPPVTLSVE